MPEILDLHPPSEPPLPATVGRYEVVRLLGEGAMGRVLLAHDPVLDRDVAVKHLRGDLKIPRDVRHGLLERMQHEARAAARVAHPNLVVLHDMGEDPAVGLYLVFEYIEGPTLKQRLLEGRLPPAEAARLARELGAALTVAHAAGIVHRDVKPENVMLARTGGKIADFGIARIPDSTLTHQGGLMGTPAYSAPETFRGGKFSALSDQFSLAASIYEAISGKRAFPGEDAVTVAARIANDPPEPFAVELGLPPAVDAALGRALDRRPEARFPDCDAFGIALSRSLASAGGRPVEGRASIPSNGGLGEGAATISRITAAPGTSSPDLLPAGPPSIPPERRTGQLILGALLVVATAALVVRTALRSAESAPAPDASAKAPDPPSPTASAAHHRQPPLGIPHVPHARVNPALVPTSGPAIPPADARADAGGAPAPAPPSSASSTPTASTKPATSGAAAASAAPVASTSPAARAP